MTNAIGRALLLALPFLASLAAAAAIVGARRGDERAARLAGRATLAAWAATAIASVLLLRSLLVHDFGNEYVVSYTDTKMAWYYLVAAFWGGQKGSLLFWALLLTSCAAIAVRWPRQRELLPWVIVTTMALLVFFAALLVFLADPFEQFLVLGTLSEGEGLNPLLQNPTMTFHPPTILAGYAIWAVPAGYAVGALVTGKLDDAWLRAVRPWAVAGWLLLSLGNLFGAWWAYEELGWGGYWGWDPVENASFLPWLTATALLHSVSGQERRGRLRIWNVSLLLLTFVLTVFGTFLTRTGLVQSVHAFASEGPLKILFLAVLALLVVVSAGLVAWRLDRLRADGRIESWLSREAALVAVNWLFVLTLAVVLWGTLFPTINRWLTGREMVLGPEWFNRFVSPVGVALLALTALGPRLSWGRTALSDLLRACLPAAAGAAALLGLLVAIVWDRPWFSFADPFAAGLALLTLFLAAFVLLDVTRSLTLTTRSRAASAGGIGAALTLGLDQHRRRYGGFLVHAGIALLYVGFAGSAFKLEQDIQVHAGETATVGGYDLTLSRVSKERLPDKQVVAAHVDASHAGTPLGELLPARHIHGDRRGSTTTEVDYRIGPLEDLYLAFIGASPSGDEVSLKVVVNPLMVWMYLGTLLLVLGAAVSLGAAPLARRLLARTGAPAPALVRARAGEDVPEPGPACPGCGRPHTPDDRFCQGCGQPLAPVCPSCGTEQAPDARFCRRCGSAIAAALVVPLLLLLSGTALAFAGMGGAPQEADDGSGGHRIGHTDVRIEVLRVGADTPEPISGARVALAALGSAAGIWPALEATSGADGAALFEAVPVVPGVTLQASTTADGARWESEPFAPKDGAAERHAIEVFPRAGDASGLEVRLLAIELFLWEGQVGFEQTWELVNLGAAAWDPRLAPSGQGALVLPLPAGAVNVHAPGQPPETAVVAGEAIRYLGLVGPGPERGVSVRATGYVPYDGPTLRFRLPATLTIRESSILVPEVPTVRSRRLDGVRLSVSGNAPFERRELAPGRAAWLSSGAPSGGIDLVIAGLPHRRAWPPWLALALALLPAVWAAWRLARRMPGPVVR